MNWMFWVGTSIFAVTIGGMLWCHTNPVVGRRRLVASTTARVVLTQLLRDQRTGYRRSAAALRRRVRLSTTEFYELMEQLVRRGLVRVVQVRTFGQDLIRFDGYQLTTDGTLEAWVAVSAESLNVD